MQGYKIIESIPNIIDVAFVIFIGTYNYQVTSTAIGEYYHRYQYHEQLNVSSFFLAILVSYASPLNDFSEILYSKLYGFTTPAFAESHPFTYIHF